MCLWMITGKFLFDKLWGDSYLYLEFHLLASIDINTFLYRQRHFAFKAMTFKHCCVIVIFDCEQVNAAWKCPF